MKSKGQIEELLTECLARLELAGIDQGEILYWETEMGTIRTFLNRVSHNGMTGDADLTMTAIRGKEVGQAQTSDLGQNGIQQLIRRATCQVGHEAPFPPYPILPGPFRNDSPSRKIFYESTLNISSGDRIKIIQEAIDHSKASQLKCSARFMNGGGRMGIINTSGTLMITEYTEASLSLILTDEKNISAYSSRSSENIEFLNKDLIFQEALENATRQKTFPVVPLCIKGSEELFDVILGPDAVAEWIETLASTGLNGLHFEEEESFVSGRLNQKLLGENICLYDDPMELLGLHAPFDFEGVPKKKVVLFEQGVAKSVCYDLLTADKFRKKSTGHALPPFERSYGAIPRHLFLKGGKSSVEEMIASSEEPTLYITRFHYTNVVNSKECLLTGMTKDGTFLIRKGKIVGPVSNLRFLESIPEALNRVTLIGEPRLVHDPVGYGGLYPEGSVVPPLKMSKVRFIGSSANLQS